MVIFIKRMFVSYHIIFLFGVLLFLGVHASAKGLMSALLPRLDPCKERPGVRGPCYANLLRYTFVNGQCVSFFYGGCLGSRNRFKDFFECQQRCEGDPCYQTPGVRGSCHANLLRYTYVPILDSCLEFPYHGCEGNDNNFESEDDCISRCVQRRGSPMEKRNCFG